MMNKVLIKLTVISVLLIITGSTAFAGPPFNTDDPEPVDFLHWEFYLASSFELGNHYDDATLPHFEVNYGAIRNVQFHLIAGMSYVKEDSEHKYSFSTVELGFKYRFINDEKNDFQVGIFPVMEIPTTSKESLVGNRNLQTFFPLWIQKTWGKFTTYGGAGYWINPGNNNKNFIFAGWLAQYDFNEVLTLGGEIYYQSPDSQDGQSDVAFKMGGIINVNDENHILVSIGHSFRNTDVVSGYLGYQLTI
jgi:Putative MetA-pathway of phenol degradation